MKDNDQDLENDNSLEKGYSDQEQFAEENPYYPEDMHLNYGCLFDNDIKDPIDLRETAEVDS